MWAICPRSALSENGRVVAGERHSMCELAFNAAWERHGMYESAFKWPNCNKERLLLHYQTAVSYCGLHPPPRRYSLREGVSTKRLGTSLVVSLAPTLSSNLIPYCFFNVREEHSQY
jgi:hypothetical protein